MKLKELPISFFVVGIMICNTSFAQLNIDNATFFIQPGAVVTVQGDVTSNVDIQGTGKLLLKGSANQNVNMGGFTIPNLELDNAANATLTGNAKIGTALLFTTGKIILGANDLTLSDIATVGGQGTSKFAETNSSGQLIKTLTADVSNVELPVGIGTSYLPAFVSSTGTYSNANVGVRVLEVADPNRPPMISDYLLAHWPVTKTGVTGTVTIKGQFATSDISGTEANLRGYYFNGTDWSSIGEAHDGSSHTVTAPISSATGDVFGMDKFVLSKTKAFLQGPFSNVLGVMADNLRTPTNLIPLSDPYRTADYNSNFIHVANPIAETADASVFNDRAFTDSNIVDWVFLELRSNTVSPGNTVLQTRSALINRKGDIVDVDGKSPVTFNNIIDGNYTIAVRHRNHLGISTNPATNLRTLGETKSIATTLDFTTATDADIYGPASAYTIMSNGKNALWAGNANVPIFTLNNNVKFLGLFNDKDYLFVTTLSSNAAQPLLNVYNPADINMNRRVSYIGLSNDKDLLLITVLGNNPASQKTQALPN